MDLFYIFLFEFEVTIENNFEIVFHISGLQESNNVRDDW